LTVVQAPAAKVSVSFLPLQRQNIAAPYGRCRVHFLISGTFFSGQPYHRRVAKKKTHERKCIIFVISRRISTVLANYVEISILFPSESFYRAIKVTKSTRVMAGHVAYMKGLMTVYKVCLRNLKGTNH